MRCRLQLRQGLLSNLFNPKIAIFFTSFLPQFIAPTDSVLGKSLLLGVIFTAMTVAWLTGYATFASKAGDLLRRPQVKGERTALNTVPLVPGALEHLHHSVSSRSHSAPTAANHCGVAAG